MSLPTMIGVPRDTSAVVLLRLEGENIRAEHLEVVEDGMPLPKRQQARALRMLADVLEAQAEAAGS